MLLADDEPLICQSDGAANGGSWIDSIEGGVQHLLQHCLRAFADQGALRPPGPPA